MKQKLLPFLLLTIMLLGLLPQDIGAQGRGWRNRGWRTDTVYCESGDMRRHWCREGIGARVQLIRQRSKAPCMRGRTWGVDRSGIWVDRGCRADFQITY